MTLDHLAFDLRQALRSLRRAPGFTAAVVLTFAVGIGATTAVFSAVDAALLRPLPYANARRLVAVQQTRNGQEVSVSYVDYLDLRAPSRAVAQLAVFAGRTFTLAGSGDPERLRGQMVSSNLFDVLGVRPLLGRAFTAEEDQAGAPRVVTISYDLWQRRFSGDSRIVGQTVPMDGQAYTVVGVMPQGFHFPDGIVFGAAQVWGPLSLLEGPDRTTRGAHPGFVGMGLLRPGATLRSARSDLAAIASRLAAEYPESNRDVGVKVDDAVDVIVGSLRGSLTLLLAAAGLVILIACANVSGLVLTRAASRQRDAAVKAALGADPWRIAVAALCEGAVLALLGGAAGIGVAAAGVRLFAPTLVDLPRLDALAIDWRSLGFALGVTFLAGLGASVAPALSAGRVDLHRWLRQRGGSNHLTRGRHALVVGEIALSIVLVVLSSLLLESFTRMRADRGGVEPRGVLTFSLTLPDAGFGDQARTVAFFQQVTQRTRALPGVSHAGAVNILPFSGGGRQNDITPVGASPDAARRTDVNAITPGYLAAMGIALVGGRDFSEADDAFAPPVAIVDEHFAQATWPGESAIGKHVAGWGADDRVIVGVVRHVKSYGVSAASRQELYAPMAQHPVSRMAVVVRTTQDPLVLIPAVRQIVASVDHTVPMNDLKTMDDVVARTVSGPKLTAFLSTGYSTAAVVLVVIGIYGVMAFLVTRRTREFGVRSALGARPTDLLRLVLGHAARLAGAGTLIGLAGAFAASRLVEHLLFGVAASDPWTFGIAAAAAIATALMASAVPALRASRVSPIIALSDD